MCMKGASGDNCESRENGPRPISRPVNSGMPAPKIGRARMKDIITELLKQPIRPLHLTDIIIAILNLPRPWPGTLAAVLFLPFLILLVLCMLQVRRSTSLDWPVVVLIVVTSLYPYLSLLLLTVTLKLDRARKVSTPWISVKDPGERLPCPEEGEDISYKHISLLHSSWRYPKKDQEFDRPMWAFHLIVVARDVVLKRIEYVQYRLHPDYPEEHRNPPPNTDRESRFALKQLAWAESVVRAEVKIKDQETLVYLAQRFCDATVN